MGNNIACLFGPPEPKNPLATLKEQLSKLGNRHPFGDDEILRLGRCHAYLLLGTTTTNDNKGVGRSCSFLSQWVTHCSTLPSADFKNPHPDDPYISIFQIDSNLSSCQKNDSMRKIYMTKVMTIVEEQILPPGFGDTLQRVAFTLPQQQQQQQQRAKQQQSKHTQHTNTNNNDETNSYEMDRLDKFLNGAANCSRRGSRKALEIMFQCCSAAAAADGGGGGRNARADALLNLAYRLGLACSLLTTAFQLYDEAININNNNDTDDDDNDEKQRQLTPLDLDELLRFCATSSFVPQNNGVKAMEESLLEYATKSQEPSSYAPNTTYATTEHHQPTNNDNDTNDTNDGTTTTVSLQLFQQWSESSAPCLSACLETFLHYILFPDRPYPPSRTEFIFPNLRGQHSAFFHHNNSNNNVIVKEMGVVEEGLQSRSSPLLFSLAAMSPSLGGAWHRLFTSDSDGLSFNRLQNALLGYSGPTLLILQEQSPSNGIFGAFTSTKWKETKDFYGNSDCFLFRIQPSVAVYRPRGRGADNYMYCNSESRSRGYDQQPHGIGFGGSIDKPRLFISETLDGCMASSGDLTFEPGALLPPPGVEGEPPRKYFELEACEVWGAGGDEVVEEALGSRLKEREIVASNISKARKVDKAQFLDDFKSGLIESKAFQHQDQIRGRDDCQIDEEDKNNYIYAK